MSSLQKFDRLTQLRPDTQERHDSAEQLARIATAFEHFVRLLESFGKAYLKARFTGRATDRWAS